MVSDTVTGRSKPGELGKFLITAIKTSGKAKNISVLS